MFLSTTKPLISLIFQPIMPTKSLTLLAVQRAAETLMLLHDKTTTLEVKKFLRKQNYQAIQADVSRMMATSVQQKAWQFHFNGNYREYQLGPDTDENWKMYLVRANEFWAIEVAKQQHIISLGQIGTNGKTFTTGFSSNRLALHKAQLLVDQKKSENYSEAIDLRLPRLLREQYKNYLNLPTKRICLSYFGIEKLEKQSANFHFKQKLLKGYWLIHKSAGYEFEFNIHSNAANIPRILETTDWDATQIVGISHHLTGEKIITKKAYGLKHEALTHFSIHKESIPTIQSLKVYNDKLYQAKLTFEGGKVLHLSKFELDPKKELLPLIKALCS